MNEYWLVADLHAPAPFTLDSRLEATTRGILKGYRATWGIDPRPMHTQRRIRMCIEAPDGASAVSTCIKVIEAALPGVSVMDVQPSADAPLKDPPGVMTVRASTSSLNWTIPASWTESQEGQANKSMAMSMAEQLREDLRASYVSKDELDRWTP